MIYVFENQNNLASIVYDETTLTIEIKGKGIAVETLPLVNAQTGKIPVLKCSKETGQVWYDYIAEPINETDRIATLEDAVAELILGGVM